MAIDTWCDIKPISFEFELSDDQIKFFRSILEEIRKEELERTCWYYYIQHIKRY